jgi:hypothetical protein
MLYAQFIRSIGLNDVCHDDSFNDRKTIYGFLRSANA